MENAHTTQPDLNSERKYGGVGVQTDLTMAELALKFEKLRLSSKIMTDLKKKWTIVLLD